MYTLYVCICYIYILHMCAYVDFFILFITYAYSIYTHTHTYFVFFGCVLGYAVCGQGTCTENWGEFCRTTFSYLHIFFGFQVVGREYDYLDDWRELCGAIAFVELLRLLLCSYCVFQSSTGAMITWKHSVEVLLLWSYCVFTDCFWCAGRGHRKYMTGASFVDQRFFS